MPQRLCCEAIKYKTTQDASMNLEVDFEQRMPAKGHNIDGVAASSSFNQRQEMNDEVGLIPAIAVFEPMPPIILED